MWCVWKSNVNQTITSKQQQKQAKWMNCIYYTFVTKLHIHKLRISNS